MTTLFDENIESAKVHSDDYAKSAGSKIWMSTRPYYVQWANQQRMAFSSLIHPVWTFLDQVQVLDFGCGTGHRINWVVSMGGQYQNAHGVDISQLRIDEGRQKNPLLQIDTYNGHTLPFEDNQFDLVMCWVVFSTIPNDQLRQRLAGEILRVLKPNGYIFWWDKKSTVASTEYGTPLDPEQLWPMLPNKTTWYASHPKPSIGLRPLRGMKRFMAPLINRLGYTPTHRASLFGPKQA